MNVSMNVSMFSSWQVRCGIADYSAHLVAALQQLPGTHIQVVPFDRQPHPQSDFVRWGQQMNAGDLAHVQHEYAFFGYLFPWHNFYKPFAAQICKPLVITRHVSFDGPLAVPGQGLKHRVWQFKWSLYNRWLGPYARYLNKDIFDQAKQVIVLSARLKTHLLQRGVDERKVHVIPAGVPTIANIPRNHALREAWGWQDKTIVGHFGFVAPPKGHALMLEALAQLPDHYVYLIAGGPRIAAHQSYVDELTQRIEALNLTQRVRITGFVPAEQVPPTLAACDLLVYPNPHADFSYSVVSGLAHRVAPVLASDIEGHREIAGYCAGLDLFRAGDAAHLAQRIQEITHQPEHVQAALAAMQRYAQAWSWQAVAEQTRSVYERALFV